MCVGRIRTLAVVFATATVPTSVWALDVADSPGSAGAPAPAAGEEAPADKGGKPTRALGIKVAAFGVQSSGNTYRSLVAIGFDARWGRGAVFCELGLGLLLSTLPPLYRDTPTGEVLDYGGINAEAGLSFFLTRRWVSPYIGLGVLPRLLVFTGDYSEPDIGLRVAGYAQAGVMFEGSRMHTYLDVRVARFFGCLNEMRREGGPTPQTNEWMSTGRQVCPLEIGLQLGVAW